MARSPVADHKIAQPELDVGPCHDCVSPKDAFARQAQDEDGRHLMIEQIAGKRENRRKVASTAFETSAFRTATSLWRDRNARKIAIRIHRKSPLGFTKVNCTLRLRRFHVAVFAKGEWQDDGRCACGPNRARAHWTDGSCFSWRS